MKPGILAIFLAFFLGSASASGGMEIGLSYPYAQTALPGRTILSLSWFTGHLSPFPGYGEYGFVAMLPVGDSKTEEQGHPKITDFAGMYAGHLFIPFRGWIRPGFNLGWVWEGRSGSTNATVRRNLSIYYSLKAQISCLTYIASNKGVGGGINFNF